MDLTNISRMLEEKEENNGFSGVVLLKHGVHTLFSGAYGYANRPWQVRNTLDTRFRVASISKMFTAAAVLQLIDQGAFDFDTPALSYLQLEGTKVPETATVYHLLTHTSGMADYFDEESDTDADWERMWKERPIYTVREVKDYLSLFADKEPVQSVGERYRYNNAGYILLGLMIGKAAGTTYFDYVENHIFAPLGMTDTGFAPLDAVAPRVAEGYEILESDEDEAVQWVRNIYGATAGAASDGGAVSTASDLVRFNRAIRNGELLSPAMTGEFLTPKVVMDKADGFEGYGWRYGFANQFLLEDTGKVIRWGHTGEEFGVSGRLYHYPELDMDLVVLGNQGWCAGSVAWDIHDVLVGRA